MLAVESGANELYMEFDPRVTDVEEWKTEHFSFRRRILKILIWMIPVTIAIWAILDRHYYK